MPALAQQHTCWRSGYGGLSRRVLRQVGARWKARAERVGVVHLPVSSELLVIEKVFGLKSLCQVLNKLEVWDT